jgi:hypothetical protein
LTDLARADSERAREIAKARYAECRRQGKAIGRAPLGKKWAGPYGQRRLVDDKPELATMKTIRELCEAGRTLDEIYWILLSKGIRRRNGSEWGRTTIHAVIRQAEECELGVAQM